MKDKVTLSNTALDDSVKSCEGHNDSVNTTVHDYFETLKKLAKNGVHLNYNDVVKICKKYHISELSIFGSAIRDDFKEDSDVDILVVWENYRKKNNRWDFVTIVDDFSELLDREVDVVDKDGLKNPIRRADILANSEIVYVAK